MDKHKKHDYMNFSNLIIEKKGQLATIILNRPKQLNALNKQTLHEIDTVLELLLNETEVGGIIITGAGEKAFAAGADIKEFVGINEADATELATKGHAIFNKIERAEKPIIAAVNGFALGGGCELAMACHMRLCSENAKFSQPEISLGIIPGYGATQRLTRYLGKAKSIELHLTGEMISAEDALKMGLVNYVYEQAVLLPETEKLLLRITKNSKDAISAILRSITAYDNNANGFTEEVKNFGTVFNSKNAQEGIKAFIEKRKPNFN